MATCRVVIAEGMRAAKALAIGDSPTVDELGVCLEALQNLTLDLHEARGPLLDVDVTANITPSENQRIRVQAGSDVEVILPNSIPLFNTPDPYDYSFNANTVAPAVGSTGIADGVEYRQPRDGARIEIVGTTQALWFYRADINQWIAATGLTVDSELPFNNRYNSAIGALLAERLLDVLPAAVPTPSLARRIGRARAALFSRPGVSRDPVVNDYF